MQTYDYPKSNRLQKADDFSSVFNFRKSRTGTYFRIHYCPNTLQHSRLGLVVSKKVHKRANKRNYMKRFLREIFRQQQVEWQLGVDIVVRVVKCFTHDEFIIARNEFLELTKRFK